jgi:hypothetical protein
MTTKKLREMIRMLRDERIAYTTLSVSAGAVTLDGVIDMKAAAETRPTPPAPRETAFERYGAELLRQPQAKANEVIPEEAMDG